MTKDRQALLLSVWERIYASTCLCGRCACVSSDPARLARIVCVHWSMQYRRMAESEERLREIYSKSAKRYAKIKSDSGSAAAEQARGYARQHGLNARRFVHATELYERLGSGLHPFRAPHAMPSNTKSEGEKTP